jgi:hypothetical protein
MSKFAYLLRGLVAPRQPRESGAVRIARLASRLQVARYSVLARNCQIERIFAMRSAADLGEFRPVVDGRRFAAICRVYVFGSVIMRGGGGNFTLDTMCPKPVLPPSWRGSSQPAKLFRK